jgi:hypothetical protein
MKNKITFVLLFVLIALTGFANAEIPPVPTDLTAVVNGGWVNYTWSVGSGNVTDSYNVSISESGGAQSWTNGSLTNTSNNNVGLNGYAEIWVYGYNSSNAGNLSSTYLYADTQAQTTFLYSVITLLGQIPEILAPIPDILAALAEVAIFGVVIGLAIAVVYSLRKYIEKILKF